MNKINPHALDYQVLVPHLGRKHYMALRTIRNAYFYSVSEAIAAAIEALAREKGVELEKLSNAGVKNLTLQEVTTAQLMQMVSEPENAQTPTEPTPTEQNHVTIPPNA